MARRMVVPKEIEVSMVARGTGVRVTAEISVEVHMRMKRELARRQLQGQSARVEDLIREILDREQENWPSANSAYRIVEERAE